MRQGVLTWLLLLVAMVFLPRTGHAVTCSGTPQFVGYDAPGVYASKSGYCSAVVAGAGGRTGAVQGEFCIINQSGWGEFVSPVQDVCLSDPSKLTAEKATDLMSLWQLFLAAGVFVFCMKALYNKFRIDHEG